MNEIIPKKDMSIADKCEMICGFLSGDFTNVLKLVETCIDTAKSIPDYLFYRNLRAVILELENKETAKRKVGKKLAKSEYGAKYGYVLLHYIISYENEEKGIFLAHLLDSLSWGYITTEECFAYCKFIMDVSLGSLIYLKNNIKKVVLYNFDDSRCYVNELFRNSLMYDSERNGKAFSREAYYLDKFALSYNDEKYSYRNKDDDIPDPEDLPKSPTYLTTR